MSNQFSVVYNGHPVAVTVLDDNKYMVQVSYKPLNIQLVKNNENEERWVEVDTQQETYLTREVGKLIESAQATSDV